LKAQHNLRDIGIWFDLHLSTADYNAEDPDVDEDNGEPKSDWQAKSVWNNYHNCTLSLTCWDGIGVKVGTEAQTLDFSSLNGHEFLIGPRSVIISDKSR